LVLGLAITTLASQHSIGTGPLLFALTASVLGIAIGVAIIALPWLFWPLKEAA
jgi:hypothetical protein